MSKTDAERSLVLVKPDGVERGLIGEVISRFERVGLKLTAIKMVRPQMDLADRHYKEDEEWGKLVHEKSKANYDKKGLDFPWGDDWKGYSDSIRRGLMDYLSSGPVVAMIVEGPHAVDLIRKLVGTTDPYSSPPGTIRGDLCVDSFARANNEKRPIVNMLHASSSTEDADAEIKVWFDDHEVNEVRNIIDDLLYNPDHFK